MVDFRHRMKDFSPKLMDFSPKLMDFRLRMKDFRRTPSVFRSLWRYWASQLAYLCVKTDRKQTENRPKYVSLDRPKKYQNSQKQASKIAPMICTVLAA